MSGVSFNDSLDLTDIYSLYVNDTFMDQQTWTASKVAEHLWENRHAHITDDTVKKVNEVSSYLKSYGYELKGTASDGNCFFSSFLGSYSTLSTRRIPLLDQSSDKIKFLREAASAQCIDLKRKEEIRSNGEWVRADEGGLLAKALDIAIRVVSFNVEIDRRIDELFSPQVTGIQNWDDIPDEKKPQEFILIVDLEGHFVYAQKDSFNEILPEATEESKVTELSEQLATLNFTKASTSPIILSEDAYGPGTFIPNSPCIVEDIDEETATLRVRMQLDDALRLNQMVCEYHKDLPFLQLQMVDQAQLPPTIAAHIKQQALEKLANSAREEQNRSQKTLSFDATDEDYEKVNHLNQKAVELEQRADSSRKEIKKFSEEWNAKLKDYYKTCLNFLALLSASPYVLSEKKSEYEIHLDGIYKELFQHFRDLRQLNPSSLVPFYPILTLLAGLLDRNLLKEYIKEAKQVDSHITYALSVTYLKLYLTTKKLPYDALSVLKALREIYREDLMIPAYQKAIEAGKLECSVDFSIIQGELKKALVALDKEDSHSAVTTLVKLNPFLEGDAFISRYLSMAWILKGSISQARKVFERSKSLPHLLKEDIPKSLIEKITRFGDIALGKKPSSISKKDQRNSDPLEAFINMAKSETLNIKLVLKFLDASVEDLKDDQQNLPIIYFGMKYLSSRLTKSVEKLNNWEPLFNLMSMTANLCCLLGSLDPFIEKNFKREVKGDHFIVSVPHITFGANSFQQTQISFEFSPNLSLSVDSMRSLATAITKQGYSLFLGLIGSHLIPEIYITNPTLPLPDDPLFFITMLIKGFSADTELMDRSIALLIKYLSAEPTPYPIDTNILDWSIFSAFAARPPTFSENGLEIEISERYLPKTITKNRLKSFLKNISCFKGFLAHSKDRSVLCLSTRDLLLAADHYEMRIEKKVVSLSGKEDLYSLFNISRFLFGWKIGEAFDDWGKRLKHEQEYSIAAPDIHLLENLQFSSNTVPKNPRIEGVINQHIRNTLALFLRFMVVFHQKTLEKNIFIEKGGDEKDSNNRTICKAWHQGLELGKWKSIIINNEPEKHPIYYNLPKNERPELIEVVRKKHAHEEEVKKLKDLCKLPGNIKSWKESIQLLTAALITNAEEKKSEEYVNIYITDEEQAIYIYQLLLEISSHRLFRSAIAKYEMPLWLEKDPNRLKERIIDCPDFGLSRLIGAFHGPEVHLSGEAPIHRHYNAGIVTSKQRIVNVHIYFG